MRSIQRSAFVSLLSLALTAGLASGLVGCGGNGGGSSPSPFQGEWAGTYNSSLGDAGNISARIQTNGDVTADVVSTANPPLVGSVSGRIRNSGAFSGSLIFGGTTYTATGDFSRNTDGTLPATLNQTDGSNSAVITVTLSPAIAM